MSEINRNPAQNIETEPSITKSKYITKYLNKQKGPLL